MLNQHDDRSSFAIWEAVLTPPAPCWEAVWIVDMSRQSLDRVVPHTAVGRQRDMFAAAG